jgi:hypothetical protein
MKRNEKERKEKERKGKKTKEKERKEKKRKCVTEHGEGGGEILLRILIAELGYTTL